MRSTDVAKDPALVRIRAMRLRLAQLVGIAAALKITVDTFEAQAAGGPSLAAMAQHALLTGALFGVIGLILGALIAAGMRWRDRS